jgi:hypothetical protein
VGFLRGCLGKICLLFWLSTLQAYLKVLTDVIFFACVKFFETRISSCLVSFSVHVTCEEWHSSKEKDSCLIVAKSLTKVIDPSKMLLCDVGILNVVYSTPKSACHPPK